MDSFRSGVTKARSCVSHGIMLPQVRNSVGLFSEAAAMSMPGTILSQLHMKTRPSKPWAFTIASALPAIRSRCGRM